MSQRFAEVLESVRQCRICEESLPLGPRPVLQIHPAAKILIAGQAPGRRVHNSGIPFDDPSGDRLREWLGISRETFYDPTKVAILPMGFCYPGTGKSGDRLAEAARIPDAQAVAASIAMLLEGSIVTAQVSGTSNAADTAKIAARVIIDNALAES